MLDNRAYVNYHVRNAARFRASPDSGAREVLVSRFGTPGYGSYSRSVNAELANRRAGGRADRQAEAALAKVRVAEGRRAGSEMVLAEAVATKVVECAAQLQPRRRRKLNVNAVPVNLPGQSYALRDPRSKRRGYGEAANPLQLPPLGTSSAPDARMARGTPTTRGIRVTSELGAAGATVGICCWMSRVQGFDEQLPPPATKQVPAPGIARARPMAARALGAGCLEDVR